MNQNVKHTPGPWAYNTEQLEHGCCYHYAIVSTVENKSYGSYPTRVAEALSEADARLVAAAPKLLAYAECEAAVACGKADPRYDPKPVLQSHGWNGQTESIGLFLTRIRRNAIEAATGSYLGRAV